MVSVQLFIFLALIISNSVVSALTSSSSCTVTIPANVMVYTESLLYGNNSFSNYNWICQGTTLSTYGNGLGTFYLEENAVFYGNGGGSHTIYLKKGSKFVSGGGGSHRIYYEKGAKYDGGGDIVTLCKPLKFVYKDINKNKKRCVNKKKPFIPTAPSTPKTTLPPTTTTTPRVQTSSAQNTGCLVKIPSSVFIYSSSSASVQATYHNDIWLCNNINITYGGWGGGYSYLEENAVVYGGGGGSRTIFLKTGSRYYSEGGGSHTIYYEQGAQFDGAGYTRLCSKLIFQYSATNGCS